MGLAGLIIFGVGLWGICFCNYIGGTTSYALITRDICRRFVPRLKVKKDSAVLSGPARRDPVYRWSLALLGLSPLYIVFLGVEPVGLTLLVRSMVVIVIPLLVGSLLVLTNDPRRMGAHKTGLFHNVVLALLVVISVYLTIRNASEWWDALFGGVINR